MLLFFQISPDMLLCNVMLLKYLLLNAHVLKSVGFCYHYTSSFVVPAYSANCVHSTLFLNCVVCYLQPLGVNYIENNKSKFTQEQAMKAYNGTGGIVVLFFGTRQGCVANAVLCRFTPRKENLYSSMGPGGSEGWSGWVWKVSPTSAFNSRTVQPIASLCTDYAILAHSYTENSLTKHES